MWQFGTTVNHVADRMRQPGDTRPQIPDYTTVDLTLQREKIAQNWEVRAALKNLFNQNAREPTFRSVGMYSDLPLPGRSLYIQFQFNLERKPAKREPTALVENPHTGSMM
jgi:iron complex outermembrane receptor protein